MTQWTRFGDEWINFGYAERVSITQSEPGGLRLGVDLASGKSHVLGVDKEKLDRQDLVEWVDALLLDKPSERLQSKFAPLLPRRSAR